VLGRGIADDDRMDLRESSVSLPPGGGCTGVAKAKHSAQCKYDFLVCQALKKQRALFSPALGVSINGHYVGV
jgi:hypothetical protein